MEISDIFPSSNFQKVRFAERQLPESVLAATLARLPIPPPKKMQPAAPKKVEPNLKCSFWKLPIGKFHLFEVATWENVTGKLSLGKVVLGKDLWESA